MKRNQNKIYLTVEKLHHRVVHNAQPTSNKIEADGNSDHKNITYTIDYDQGETLEIKDEIIEVPGSSSIKSIKPANNKEYHLKECTVDIRKNEKLIASRMRQLKYQQNIKKSEKQVKKKYECSKCGRCYSYMRGLKSHQRYECDAIPQFTCLVCNKKFKQKSVLRRHVGQVHLSLKEAIGTSKTRHNCHEYYHSYMLQYNSGISKNQGTKDNRLKKDKIDTKISSNEKDLTFTLKYRKEGSSEIKEKVIKGEGSCSNRDMEPSDNLKYLSRIKRDDTSAVYKIAPKKMQKIRDSKAEAKQQYKCEKCARNKQKSKRKSKKSTGRGDGGPYSCTTTNISSDKKSGTKTLIEYDIDETLEIKEEIIDDYESAESQKPIQKYESKLFAVGIREHRDVLAYKCDKCHLREELNLIPERNQFEEKFITADISSGDYSVSKTFIKYESNETFEIKEEILQDEESSWKEVTHQESIKTYDSKLSSLNMRETDNVTSKKKVSCQKRQKTKDSKPEKMYKCEKCARSYTQRQNLYRHKRLVCYVNPRIQETKQKSQQKFKCEKCTRIYKWKFSLNFHQKYECDVTPQFHCELCGKSFKQKGALNRHLGIVHINTNPYLSVAIKSQFICDICGHTATGKVQKAKIESRKSPGIMATGPYSYPATEICLGNNSGAKTLIEYINDKNLEIKEEIIQDKLPTKKKQNIEDLKQEPENKYRCEKCARRYKWKKHLNHHVKYECDVIPQFTYQETFVKVEDGLHSSFHYTTIEISSHNNSDVNTSFEYCNADILDIKHVIIQDQEPEEFTDKKIAKLIQEPENKYKCEKCARRYKWKKHLNQHLKYECDVMPQFGCQFCGDLFKRKSILNRHVNHKKTSLKTTIRGKRNVKYRKGTEGEMHTSFQCVYFLEYKPTSENSSDNFGAKTSIEYDHNETLDIKDEIFQDRESKEVTGQNLEEKYVVRPELEKKYKCEKCARRFKWKKHLNHHLKYECGIILQFTCKFCGKQFTRKRNMTRHVALAHLKTELQPSKMRHNCDQCRRLMIIGNERKVFDAWDRKRKC
ncbi:zinc finger protein 208-like [Belonocnema kinseyi]|uniref:zinc finger protein 208-like n=1 Tax=Belonocnema kinseyi TaxID=2817044 RepID=UPI00143CEBEE|nr:zinc finger protein 208-like [Belonocnema kinseyi]